MSRNSLADTLTEQLEEKQAAFEASLVVIDSLRAELNEVRQQLKMAKIQIKEANDNKPG